MITEEQIERMRSLMAEYVSPGSSPTARFGIERELLAMLPDLLTHAERLREAIWPGLPKWEPTAEAPQQDFFEAVAESFRTENERLNTLPDWLVRKLKTLGEYYESPTDGRDAVSEIQGWMHVLCFHYLQNRREVKEYDAARRKAKELEAENARLEAMLAAIVLNYSPETTIGTYRATAEVWLNERDKLTAFKDYVHARLDAAGVTVDPESAHKVEGCRVGGRLDEVFAERDKLRTALKPFAELSEWTDVEGDEESGSPPLPDRYTLTWTAVRKPETIDHMPGHPTVGDCRRAADLLAGKDVAK